MMRLRLKNTFVEVDFEQGLDEQVGLIGGSSPCLASLGSLSGPSTVRSRSVEVKSPSRLLDENDDDRTCCPQLDRLNDFLLADRRPRPRPLMERCGPRSLLTGSPSNTPQQDVASCRGSRALSPTASDCEDAPASSACSTVSLGSFPTLKRQAWSFDFSSTEPSEPSTVHAQREYCHKEVPRLLDFQTCAEIIDDGSANRDSQQGITTLMIRNIPNRYGQEDLLEDLKGSGFGGVVDFLYLPRDKSSKAGIGYAFVNFTSCVWAQRCAEVFSSFKFLRYGRGRDAVVSTAHLQGLDANREHYEKSAIASSRIAKHRPLFPEVNPAK